jgi:hypothetical protein
MSHNHHKTITYNNHQLTATTIERSSFPNFEMLFHYHLVSVFPLRGLLECMVPFIPTDGFSFDRSGPRLLRLKRLSRTCCFISHRYYYLHEKYSSSVWGPKESLTTTLVSVFPFERSPRVYLLFPPMGSPSIRAGHGSCG